MEYPPQETEPGHYGNWQDPLIGVLLAGLVCVMAIDHTNRLPSGKASITGDDVRSVGAARLDRPTRKTGPGAGHSP